MKGEWILNFENFELYMINKLKKEKLELNIKLKNNILLNPFCSFLHNQPQLINVGVLISSGVGVKKCKQKQAGASIWHLRV